MNIHVYRRRQPFKDKIVVCFEPHERDKILSLSELLPGKLIPHFEVEVDALTILEHLPEGRYENVFLSETSD